MKNKLFSFLKYLVFLAVGIILLYFSFKDKDIGGMLKDVRGANFLWVAVAMLFALIAFYSRALRWKMMIAPMGFNPAIKNTLYSMMGGYFFNLLIPRLGEVSRCALLHKAEKIPLNGLIGTVIAERVIDILCLAASMLLVIAMNYSLLGSFLLDHTLRPLSEKLSALVHHSLFIPLMLVCILVVAGAVYVVIKKRKNSVLLGRIHHLVAGVLEGLRTVVKIKRMNLFLFHTVFIWVMYFLSCYSCFYALKATSGLGATEGLFILVVGSLGMTAPVQGGFGVYHFVVSKGLLLFNVPEQDGLLYATILHEAQTFFILLLGGLSLIFLMLSGKKETHEHSREHS